MPVRDLRRYVLTTIGVVYLLIGLTAALLALGGCGPTLADQRRMGSHVAAALRACKQNGARCAPAKRCKDAAVKARDAMNAAREAGAGMRPTAELDAQAAELAAKADAACAAIGGSK